MNNTRIKRAAQRFLRRTSESADRGYQSPAIARQGLRRRGSKLLKGQRRRVGGHRA